MKSNIECEIESCEFADKRLSARFKKLVLSLASAAERSIPFACQDWAATKGAYRFLTNAKVSEGAILSGHFEATKLRALKVKGKILAIQDTTEFGYPGERRGIDYSGTTAFGASKRHLRRGILMHSCLLTTQEGLPLGLSSAKFWTRKESKGTRALKRSVNPTRIPIEEKESIRWLQSISHTNDLLKQPRKCVHVGDRESDIYELFCLTRKLGTHFLGTCPV